MKVTTVDIGTTRYGEWHHLTPLSDVHLGSAACDLGALRRLIAERNALPRHRWIGLGDLGDWILPKDPRYRPSTLGGSLHGRDNLVARTLELQRKELEAVKFDLVGVGNHELAALSHHSIDVVDAFCRATGARYGGYSGYLRYRVKVSGRTRPGLMALYHHGAWGGRSSKGLPGLRDWARYYDGWDVALAGHNHQTLVDPEVRLRPGETDCRERPVYHIICGTMAKHSAEPLSYAEAKGYPPVRLGAPLIAWRLVSDRQGRGRAKAPSAARLELKVTV